MDEQTTLHTNEKNRNEEDRPKNTNLVTRRFDADKSPSNKGARGGYSTESPSGTLSAPLKQPSHNPLTERETPVPHGRTFVLGGKIYHEIRTLSQSSGEAQVLLVERHGKKAVMKLYYPGYIPEHGVLKVVWNMDFEMIVHLYDYGTTIVGGITREYELMEWLEGISLADYSLKGDLQMFKRIALQAASALEYCHNCNLIHKDVKMGNFIFRDKEMDELVLTDFGISTIVSDDEALHKTTQARTPLYASPEMYENVIDGEVELTPATDYYSLGIVLFFLWLGKSPFSGNERAMMRMKSEGKLPNLNLLPEEVSLLVRGLTVVNPEKRWKYNEIERWYKGERVEVDESSIYLKYKSFVVDSEKNVLASNAKELAALLAERKHLGIKYLYGKVISEWLEECGNQKLAVELDDIVNKRYPLNPDMGFQAALYTLDNKLPYQDNRGNRCNNVHEVVMTILANMEDYKLLLQDENHPLYIYLEMTTELEVVRLKELFRTSTPEIALWRFIYEIDNTIPFLLDKPSSTIDEIIKAFAEMPCREDEWRALTDGRLLSWVYYKCDPMTYVELKEIYDQHLPYSRSEAYRALYHLNRHTGFNLKGATEREQVAALMANALVEAQYASDKEFERIMEEYIAPNSRLYYYAEMRGWKDVCMLHTYTFDLHHPDHVNRYGVYDKRVAAYRFCASMGHTPEYYFRTGGQVVDSIEGFYAKDAHILRSEITQGSLKQWLAIFFHENPKEPFAEKYSYEKSLIEYLKIIGKYDTDDLYYKRWRYANETGDKQQSGYLHTSNRIKSREEKLKWALASTSAILCAMMLIFGYSNPTLLLNNAAFAIALPVGCCTMLLAATWSYFHGNGPLMTLLSAAFGAGIGWVPVAILRHIGPQHPQTLVMATVGMIVGCTVLAFFIGRQKSIYKWGELKPLFQADYNATMLDTLHYTYKRKVQTYKGSNYRAIEDAINTMKATKLEFVVHFELWIALMLILIVLFILYHNSLLDIATPNVDTVKESIRGWVEKVTSE